MKQKLATCVCALLAGVSASASLLFHESFSYTSGLDNHISEGNWTSGSGNAPHASVGSSFFTSTNLNPFGITGGSLRSFSGRESAVAVPGATAFDTPYYFSFMFEATGNSTQQSGVEFRTSNNRRFDVGFLNGSFGLGDNHGFDENTAIGDTTEYFVVGFIRVDNDGAGVNNDSYVMGANIYTSAADAITFGSSNPTLTATDWTSFRSEDFPNFGNLAFAIDSIALDTQGGISSHFDEIRIGTTLESVAVPVAVPEPRAYALFAGFLAIGLIAWRQRKVGK